MVNFQIQYDIRAYNNMQQHVCETIYSQYNEFVCYWVDFHSVTDFISCINTVLHQASSE